MQGGNAFANTSSRYGMTKYEAAMGQCERFETAN
jgi:hypothetical protein